MEKGIQVDNMKSNSYLSSSLNQYITKLSTVANSRMEILFINYSNCCISVFLPPFVQGKQQMCSLEAVLT